MTCGLIVHEKVVGMKKKVHRAKRCYARSSFIDTSISLGR